MQEKVIELKNISKVYKLYKNKRDRLKEALFFFSKKKYHNDFYALDNINLEVKKGEILGLVGTNGAGKSTLLKIITGVLTPTSGKIKIKGKISALIELGAGFNPEYTGIENIELYGTLMGLEKEEIEAKKEEIINFADIGEFVYQPVKNYSSGMFARLAFSVAINVDPEILIVDEALSVGDVFFQLKCYKKFTEFTKKGKTILFVTHDMGSVLKYCNRAVLIEKGKKIEDSTPKIVIDKYKKIMVGIAEDVEKNNTIETIQINSKKLEILKNNMEINKDFTEYGELDAEIIDFAFLNRGKITNNMEKGDNVTIKMKVKFHKEVKEPIFAFTIKDRKGTEIVGTNTQLEKISFGIVKAGEIVEVNFSQEIFLQSGEYLMSYGCTGFKNDKFVVYHRLYDVYRIVILSDKDTIGFYDMRSVVSVNRSNI